MTQLNLFNDPIQEPAEEPLDLMPGQLDSTAWRAAKNTTPTRCDKCTNWSRSLSNFWGECSVRKSYEHEYGGKGCKDFAPTRTAPHVPEGDSPFCSDCQFFINKVVPLGKTGGWIGKAGDCSVHGVQVEAVATCSEHKWVSDEARERFEGYLRKVGRLKDKRLTD